MSDLLDIETRIRYYKEDIERWESYLKETNYKDKLVEKAVNELKEAVKTLEEKLNNK